MRLNARASELYADILPEVARILDNTITTTQTLESKEDTLNAALDDITRFSDTARVFLDNNADRLERFGTLSTQTLQVLSRYSPTFPCLSQGLVNFAPRMAEAYRGYEHLIVVQTLPNKPRSDDVDHTPRFAEDRAPHCVHLPSPPWSQANPLRQVPNFNDGVDEPTGKGTMRPAPADPLTYQGAPEDVAVLRQLLGEQYGADADSGLGVLLAGPIVAGGGAG